MGFSTFPNNPFPPSTAQFDEGKNNDIQAEIDAIKDGTNIDSFADVESALATKTNLSNIAPAFDATSGVYAVGDEVIYDGVLYEFTSAHSTAGEWDESEVQPVKVSELIDSLKNGLTNLEFTNYGGIGTASNFNASLRKVSNIAFLSVGDFVSLPAGETVLTGKIPVGYRPAYDVDFTLTQRNVSPRILAFSVKSNGNISVYNYGAEISSDTAFADTLAWPIGS